jgi:hypothetical protein
MTNTQTQAQAQATPIVNPDFERPRQNPEVRFSNDPVLGPQYPWLSTIKGEEIQVVSMYSCRQVLKVRSTYIRHFTEWIANENPSIEGVYIFVSDGCVRNVYFRYDATEEVKKEAVRRVRALYRRFVKEE